jgi:DNA polymerase-3 subunit delta'
MPPEPLMNPSTKLLVNSFIKNPASSIGFNGPKDSGKLRIARYLCSHALNLKPNEFEIKVDVIECADKSGIDDIRELKKKLSIKSIGEEGSYSRAVILSDFHKISVPAQNSILKLLEEPPTDTILILLVDSKSSILPTIVSRLQWVDVLPLDLPTFEENYNQYEKGEIKQAYLLSEGYVLSFEKIMQDEKNAIKLAVDDVKKILKLKKYERISSLDKILNNQNYTPEEFLTAMQKIYLTLVHREIENNTKLQGRILYGLEQINRAKESLKHNANQKLLLTNLFYKI